MSPNIQVTPSQTSLSTLSPTPTSLSEHQPRSSTAHLVRSNSAKNARGGSLGLIDAARVRFSKDFPSLLRANSKSHRTKSSLLPQVRVSEIDLSALPDYAKRSNPDLAHTGNNLMDSSGGQTERHGRSLGSRIVNFLSRSRSRSRSKKRSHSVDVVKNEETPSIPPKSVGSLGRHTRHSSFRDEQPSTSVSTSASTTLSKPSTRSQSRPFSSTVVNNIPPSKALPDVPSQHRSYIPTSSHLLAPQPRSAVVHVLNSPPMPRGEYGRNGVDAPDSGDYGGRCTPLCLSTSRFTPPGSRNKGKEKERPRSARDKDDSAVRDKDRERITAPRRVGSPLLRAEARESRTAITPIPIDRIASGGGQSRRSSGRESAAANGITVSKVKRIKHGSFDFERPVSSARQDAYYMSKATSRGLGPGHETHSPSMLPVPMMRSASMQATSRSSAANGNAHGKSLASKSKQSSTPPDSFGRSRRPLLGLGLQPTSTYTGSKAHRQGTGDSGGSSSHASHSAPAHRTHFAHTDLDPNSQGSSQSESSSWGKSGGKHVIRASHGAFKFEPAVPTIPGSPASDERRSTARGPPRPSNLTYTTPPRTASPSPISPTRTGLERAKGRSLDLGLGLSWAPSKVREEAVLPRGTPGTTSSTSRVRGKYKGGWVQRDGRYELGLDNGQSPAGADVAKAFNDALGDAAYSTFKLFVHRFDAHAIPLEGPYGLIYHARRLLDEANTLDERSKRALVDRFVRFVQETQ